MPVGDVKEAPAADRVKPAELGVCRRAQFETDRLGCVGDVAAGKTFLELSQQGLKGDVAGVASPAQEYGVGEQVEVVAEAAAGPVVDWRRMLLQTGE